MSKTGRPYNIGTQPAVGETVVAEDSVTSKLDLPPVLPREVMGRMLQGKLVERKFEESSPGKMVRERSGVKVEVDTQKGEVTISAREDATIPPPPPDNPSPCSCRIGRAARVGQIQSDHKLSELQERVTSRLEGALARTGCEMEGCLNQVLKEALLEKARGCGEVKQVTEGTDGSMTILVEV
jgi:hypothetical protein